MQLSAKLYAIAEIIQYKYYDNKTEINTACKDSFFLEEDVAVSKHHKLIVQHRHFDKYYFRTLFHFRDFKLEQTPYLVGTID